MKCTLAAATAVTCTFTALASADLLWDNGVANGAEPGSLGMITHHGVGPGGADVSVTGSNLHIMGTNFSKVTSWGPHDRRADDFVVDGDGWRVDSITIFGFAPGADPGTSPFGTVNLNIWTDVPGWTEAGDVPEGATATYIAEFANVYRQWAGTFPDNTNNAVFAIELTFDQPIILTPGTYWIDYAQSENLPWVYTPPITKLLNGDPYTAEGNSMYIDTVGEWQFSSGYDLPFLVHGRSLPLTGDLNGDAVVDVSDLLILLTAWGPCPPSSECPADLDDNGAVDVSDLLILLANWG